MFNFLQSRNDQEDTHEMSLQETIDMKEKLVILKGNLTSNESFRVNATMGTLNNPSTWSNREGEWFCAEKRLLFSTDRARDKEKWLRLFKKYIPG